MKRRLPGIEKSVRRAFSKRIKGSKVVAILNFYGRRILVVVAEKCGYVGLPRFLGGYYNSEQDTIVIFRASLKSPIPSGLRHAIAHEMAHAASRRRLRRRISPVAKKARGYARNKFEAEAEMAAIVAADIPFLKSRLPSMMTKLLQTAYPQLREWEGSRLEKMLYEKLKREFGCR